MPDSDSLISRARAEFHAQVLNRLLVTDESGVLSNADRGSRSSAAIAAGIARRLGDSQVGPRLPGQISGATFEGLVLSFLKATFPQLSHLRPGTWEILKTGDRIGIAAYQQYEHLTKLAARARGDPELAAVLGRDYLIAPDAVVIRRPELDSTINAHSKIVDSSSAVRSSLRSSNSDVALLHAVVSSKWTIRSDRAQNVRTEALNLVRNRKGHLPHIVVVTAEPTPGRLASLALGTGDVDCVYHFALPELEATVAELEYTDSVDLLHVMVAGLRLKDISDLPLDLAV